MKKIKYRRITLKLSGEALGSDKEIFCKQAIHRIATQIKELHEHDVQIIVVVGGGNIFRGNLGPLFGLEQVPADQMGMLCTVVNALMLENLLKQMGVDAVAMTSVPIDRFADQYIERKALRYLDAKRVVILGGGTGNALCTTDTAAATRAVELKSDVIIKATKVDGIYDRDPHKHADAQRVSSPMTHQYALLHSIGVMDETAFVYCKTWNMPIIVLSLHKQGILLQAVCGEDVGTRVETLTMAPEASMPPAPKAVAVA